MNFRGDNLTFALGPRASARLFCRASSPGYRTHPLRPAFAIEERKGHPFGSKPPVASIESMPYPSPEGRTIHAQVLMHCDYMVLLW